MDPRFLDADWSITRREYPEGVWGINQMGPAWTTLEKNIQQLAVAAASFYERIPRKEEFKIFFRGIGEGMLSDAELDRYEVHPFRDEEILQTIDPNLDPRAPGPVGERMIRRTYAIPLSPEEDGAARPEYYLPSGQQIEDTYAHHNNPLALGRTRDWIVRFVRQHLPDLAAVPKSEHEFQSALAAYYAYEHRALNAAKLAQLTPVELSPEEKQKQTLQKITGHASTYSAARKGLLDWKAGELATMEAAGMSVRDLSEQSRQLDLVIKRELDALAQKFAGEVAKE